MKSLGMLEQGCGALFLVAVCASLLSACVEGAGAGPGAGAFVSIDGTVTGLEGTIILQNNGGDDLILMDDLALTGDGVFAFPTGLQQGEAYNVTVLMHSDGQICAVDLVAGVVGDANVAWSETPTSRGRRRQRH